ncbi:hypothetical protein BC939DRAFT_441906 [Gamsiella multidivaricata]|uniref:uncharacterized protein n=1 Tax=Gamsiella multidivaricata TaxID=101098 RepID=UPI0022206B5E|nr:uncharacterized protein BC939DRAFT_441906 [Gamsiella multidivaricata]KAI7829440.1 hypothetical protein BC939DRAFT_441906 [Gamsiella multidivaricata]
MDSSSWTGSNTSAHQTVGPIPMGFDWRDQNLSPSDSASRPMSLQGFHSTSNNQNGNNNSNGVIPGHGPISHGTLGAETGMNTPGVHTHHNGDPLASSLAAGALQQQGDMQVRTTPPTPSREDFHHHGHPHHGQQQQQQQPLHVHHTHSPYHHGQLSGHELSPHEQQQQQQQQQQFQQQHSAYTPGHYYPEQDQHESYDHDRMHSGGLVGHPYGHSHDNLAALTPPPSAPVPQHDLPPLRTRLTNTIWEDEHTFCFQVDVKGVCVARRADNHMVNGTKLLNVVGMSRGKRDGILKNEKGRVVVKVGAMHLKGVWIPLDRAVHHAKAHNIEEILYPLLVDDPTAFLYQHPHTASVTSDMRWTSQSQQQQQQQHGSYHESDNSPKGRHSDMHSNHHFNQGVHGDYYSHQHHPVFRGHGVNSPHGSPHGSNGSVSGDDDPNLVSPFEYRVQSSMATGGLIGIPSGGPSSVSDLRSGNHHAAYYGHQASPNQYYGAHVPQKYQDSIMHPGQHQLQLGGPLANDSPPPLSASSAHDGPQNRIQAGVLAGQKRGYGPNVSEAAHNYYGYQAHPQKDVYPTDPGQFGVVASGMSTGNFSPPLSVTPSEPHSPMSQQHHSQDQHAVQASNPPPKRPRQISRGTSNTTADSPASSAGQWYGRDDSFDRSSGQTVTSVDASGPGSLNYGVVSDSGNGMYYDSLALTQQQQQKSLNAPREGDVGLAGRPRFMPGAAQSPMQYSASGTISPQRSRSRLSFQDGASVGGAMAQQGAVSTFGRMSPDDTKQTVYVRPQSGSEGDSNVPQLVKVEGVAGGFGHDTAATWA